tara:strand:+ start:681 stop:1007 length:327 start_codon:yes stop_codon:yes gene_type:complete
MIAIASWLIFGVKSGYSSILGGVITIVPNTYLAWRVFRFQGAKSARQIVNGLYKGEAIKFLITLILFAIVFICLSVNALVLFITFMTVQATIWFAPLFFDIKHRPESD